MRLVLAVATALFFLPAPPGPAFGGELGADAWDGFEWTPEIDGEGSILAAEKALRAVGAGEGSGFGFAERMLAGLGNAKETIRLLDENVAGAIVMLSHMDDLSGHGDLVDWVLDAAKEAEGLRRESAGRLAALARGIEEWASLPAERRDGMSMDRLDVLNSSLEEGNVRLQCLAAGVRAFSERVNELRIAEVPIIADGILAEAARSRAARERLIRELSGRRDAVYYDLRASGALERRK